MDSEKENLGAASERENTCREAGRVSPTTYIINPVRHFTDGIETQAEL